MRVRVDRRARQLVRKGRGADHGLAAAHVAPPGGEVMEDVAAGVLAVAPEQPVEGRVVVALAAVRVVRL